MAQSQADVAVIGGGIAGLACAGGLTDAGLSVRVFDKGRGPGGRLSSRRTDVGRFDHGAQYFTARSDAFQEAVAGWLADGVVAEWRARFAAMKHGAVVEETPSAPRFVGAPRMNALVAHLAEPLEVRFGVRVRPPAREDHVWRLASEEGEDLGLYGALAVAAPAEQAVDLLAAAPALAAEAAAVRSAPCWAAMLAYDAPLDLSFDGLKGDGAPVAWASREASRPGREPGERLVVHASPDWSRAHLEETPDAVARALAAAVSDRLAAPAPAFAVAHRWRFAQVENAAGVAWAFDPDLRVGACGDWRLGPRIEHAWTSGRDLARRILAAS